MCYGAYLDKKPKASWGDRFATVFIVFCAVAIVAAVTLSVLFA